MSTPINEKKITIGMYDILDADVGSITLHHVYTAEGDLLYHVIINLNIEDGTDDGIWITIDTTINHPCKVCAAEEAAVVIASLSKGAVPTVLVFDKNSVLTEEFSMFDQPPHLDEETNISTPKTRVLH